MNIADDQVLPSIDPDVDTDTELAITKVPVSASASDPDGDPLTFRWSAPAGAFSDGSAQRTMFLCPITSERVPLTVTVDDGRGGVATDTITVQCKSEMQ
jgi:hypothetical protein